MTTTYSDYQTASLKNRSLHDHMFATREWGEGTKVVMGFLDSKEAFGSMKRYHQQNNHGMPIHEEHRLNGSNRQQHHMTRIKK